LFGRRVWQIQERINGCHSDVFGAIRDLQDFVASAGFTFLQHAKVEARPVMGNEQSGHCRLCHSDPHAIASDARLSNLDEDAPDAVSIADANLIISQAIYCEVFTKLSKRKIFASELSLPIAISVHLIDHHRALLASMPSEISLPIAFHIQATDSNPALHWLLPNRRVDFLAPPCDVTRKPNVD
jgi:hypothetical protein